MIVFVAPADDIWEMSEYLEQHGGPFTERLKILTYEDLVTQPELPVGTCIFAAIDRISPTEREIATRYWDAVSNASPGARLINHPAHALRRYELLTACFEQRRNAFGARRATEFHRRQRFPVFVRPESDHTGSLTPVLHNRRQLTRALAKILMWGYRLRDLLIVEYCDTADASGVFRLYSAAIVGDAIIPKSLVHSRNWVTKWEGRLLEPHHAREQAEYVEGHPHEKWLRETFALAKIGYGFINYGLKDGGPQVWEINTNPTLTRRTGAPSVMTEAQWAVLAPVQSRFIRRFQDALQGIDTAGDPNRRVRIAVTPAQRRQLDLEKRQQRRLRARGTAIARAAAGPLWVRRQLLGTTPRG